MMKRVLLILLGFAVLVGGCDTAAHVIRTPQVPASPPMVLPSAGPAVVGKPAFQAGIDVDLFAWKGIDYATQTAEFLKVAQQMHVNSVSISFPVYTGAASSLYGTGFTPPPGQLANVSEQLEAAGFWVEWRPVLAVGDRTGFTPANRELWLRNYATFLLPFAAAAQRVRVGEFIMGTELSEFQTAPGWRLADQRIAGVYHGILGCSANWNPDPGGPAINSGIPGACGPDAALAVDAYAPQQQPFTPGWTAWDAALPAGMVETEVGIAAADGAWRKPWLTSWPVTHTDPAVQAQWFSAACSAAVATHLGGIYFWSVPLGSLPTQTLANQSYFSQETVNAISACYKGIK